MCGICGFISSENIKIDKLKAMNETLSHRGPDDHGEEIYQLNSKWNVGFAHRRLSIIDLSDMGHQPMHSLDKRISVVYNGEIYNFFELKKQLNGYLFSTKCDTEVIIAAYLKWGIKFVEKINGMFAIALLDRETNSVYLIRDRIGKKPLYYYVDSQKSVVFASELKAIMEYSYEVKEVNKEIIGRLLHKQYIANPDTIFKNVFKVIPGTFVKIENGEISKQKYWDIAEKYNELNKEIIHDYDEAKNVLKEELKKAVHNRMIADVPIGAFLSGGYDSSLICALAQEQSNSPIKTFCIGFNEKQYNEAEYAKKVANYIGTNHKELYINNKEMLELVDSIPQYYDEPFADASQIPTMLVSMLAKKDVSVVLSGDGGDELFGGYNIYTHLQMAQKKEKIGKILRGIKKIPQVSDRNFWDSLPIEYRILTDDVHSENKTQTGISMYMDTINGLLIKEADNFYYEYESKYKERRYEMIRMLLDLETYLPEDILTKVDRGSMKYALECRCPFLDKEVIEYAFKLPVSYKDDNGNQKRIIKDIAYEYVPRELLDRPKTGFSVPLDKWLRGELKDKLLDWTSKEYLIKQGIFDPDKTIKFVSEYVKNGDQGKWSGKNYSKICWPYFIFQQWYSYYFNCGK